MPRPILTITLSILTFLVASTTSYLGFNHSSQLAQLIEPALVFRVPSMTPVSFLKNSLPTAVKTFAKTGTEEENKKELQNLTKQLLWLNGRLNQTKNETVRQQFISLIRQVAEKRKQQFALLLDQDSFSVWTNVIKESEYSKLPSEIKNKIETKTVLEGEVEVAHFDSERPHFEYFLKSQGRKFQLYPIFETPPISSGTTIRVEGYLLENKILVPITKNTFAVLERGLQSIETQPIETLGEQRTAVILVRFADSPDQPPFTQEQIYGVIFNGQVQQFFRENSFQKTWFSGNVFGWYTSTATCEDGGGFVSAKAAIELSDPDIYFPDFDRIIVISDGFCYPEPNGYATVGKIELSSADGTFWASTSTIRNSVHFFDEVPLPSGGARTYSWTSGPGLVIHELGHNFGVWHANNWECGPETIYGGCKHNEYGNFFDVMGRGWIYDPDTGDDFQSNLNAAFHLNGFFKKKFGWLAGNNYLKITQNGTYTLEPLEKNGAVVAEIKQILDSRIAPYYLEYRIPFGFDESLNDPLSQGNKGGIFVNRRQTFRGEIVPGTQLIDLSPTSGGYYDKDWYNAALALNKTFFDQGAGIRIKNLKIPQTPDNPKASFSVQFSQPECVRVRPSLRIYGSPVIEARPGDVVDLRWFGLEPEAKNNDSIICAASTFEFRIGPLPIGWDYVFEPRQMILPPEYSRWPDTFTISVPKNAAKGDYLVPIRVKNLDSGLWDQITVIIRVIIGCDPGWQYFSQINKCVFNGHDLGMNFNDAALFCQSQGGWLPYSQEIASICSGFQLRPGQGCGPGGNYNCVGFVRVSDPFEFGGQTFGHKLWHDQGYHFTNEACGDVIYDFCGTQAYNPQCQLVDSWIEDERNDYGVICLKEPS